MKIELNNIIHIARTVLGYVLIGSLLWILVSTLLFAGFILVKGL